VCVCVCVCVRLRARAGRRGLQYGVSPVSFMWFLFRHENEMLNCEQ